MPVSVFSPQALEKLVKETLPADAKPGENVIVGALDERGAQVTAAFKMRDRWSFEAAARMEWTGDASLGARVLYRWQ